MMMTTVMMLLMSPVVELISGYEQKRRTSAFINGSFQAGEHNGGVAGQSRNAARDVFQ